MGPGEAVPPVPADSPSLAKPPGPPVQLAYMTLRQAQRFALSVSRGVARISLRGDPWLVLGPADLGGAHKFTMLVVTTFFFNPRGTGSPAERIALVGYVSPSSSEPNWSQIDVRGGYRKLSE